MRPLFYLPIVLLALMSCVGTKELLIAHQHPHVVFEGRVQSNTNNGTELYWPGSSINLTFEGSEIYATLQDEKGENLYQILIDGQDYGILQPNSTKQTYLLASGLSKQKHQLKLFRRTEFTSGKTIFYGFTLKNSGKTFAPNLPKKRFIEFYGDSVTAGHGLDDSSGKDSGEAKFYNNYLAYGAITARHFNADYQCVCKGGIGLMISWFPYTIEDIYNKTNPLAPNSNWNFSKKPDVVVVNLMQNDSWLVKKKDHKEFERVFGDTPPSEEFIVNAYVSFLQKIRNQYPDSNIICALGNMDVTKKGSVWPNYVEKALDKMKDSKTHLVVFPFKETKGHPNKTEQEAMAKLLIAYIEKNIAW